MIRSTRPTRVAVAVSVLALAAGGALLVSPVRADTGESAPVAYDCTSPTLGDLTITATHSMPDSVVWGGTLPVTTVMTLPAELVDDLDSVGIKALDGDVVNHASAGVFGGLGIVYRGIEFTQTVPRTSTPASGTMDLTAVGDVATAPWGGARAGTVLHVEMWQINGTEIEAHLHSYDAQDQRSTVPQTVTCDLQDEKTPPVVDVTVVQAATASVAKLTCSARKGILTGRVTVDAPDSAVTPYGSVTLTLRKGRRTVGGSVTKTLDAQGVASTSWKGLSAGTYKLLAAYASSNRNFGPSSASTTKTIG